MFIGGVILCMVVFGLLVGYALVVLYFRGKGVVFGVVLFVLVVLF